MTEEPGLDLHEWETQWAQAEEDAVDEPDQALSEMVRLLEEMLEERGYAVRERVTAEGDDPEVLKTFLGARDLARAAEAGELDPEDIQTTLEDLRDLHGYLVSERAEP